MKKNFTSWLIFIFSILSLWYVLAYFFNNAFILPYPNTVFYSMINFLSRKEFYVASIFTMTRVVVSICFSFLFGFIFAFINSKNKVLQSFFSKALLIIRTLPNVAIIILLLFWLPREITVFVVSFLLLFPIVYEELYNMILQINVQYYDLFIIYDQSFISKFRYVYLPLLKASISSTLISTGSLAFKVIVMAEILAQVSLGIGRRIQISKVNVDIHEVMAWTIWIIIFVFVFDFIYKKIINFLFK